MTTVPQHQPLHQRQQRHSQYQQQQHQYRQHAPPPPPQHQQHQHQHQHQRHYGLDAPLDAYDPDEEVPRASPPMKALDLRIKPSPSTSPEIPPGQIRPVSGDAVLVSHLDNGRHPEIAQEAASQALPADDEDDEDEDSYEDDSVEYSSDDGRRGGSSCPDAFRRVGGKDALAQARDPMTATTALQAVAVDALQAVAAEAPRHRVLYKPATDISISTLQLSIHDDHLSNIARHPRDVSLPGSHLRRTGGPSPSMDMLTPSELPPLLDSPKSESNGGQSLSLPSIRSTLSDINLAEPPTPVDRDQSTRHGGHAQVFSRSPPVGVPRFHAMSSSHVSPPISPNETYQRSLPSPHSLPASSPFYANGLHHRPSDTPSTDHTSSTPATTASIADRMSIDGITNPQVGYVCHFTGCMAPPFQTQYLLNSHANVHSLARPHYCAVPGCPRSEGGKGFKRKNEMIRHGLVHDSPGYVCPFCADREHKYPRPDNLQRHVRVHHVDKDKDDPRLRDVLSQRPDGPNRGRRRRGAPP